MPKSKLSTPAQRAPMMVEEMVSGVYVYQETMTVQELIKKLEALQAKYPGQDLTLIPDYDEGYEVWIKRPETPAEYAKRMAKLDARDAKIIARDQAELARLKAAYPDDPK